MSTADFRAGSGEGDGECDRDEFFFFSTAGFRAGSGEGDGDRDGDRDEGGDDSTTGVLLEEEPPLASLFRSRIVFRGFARCSSTSISSSSAVTDSGAFLDLFDVNFLGAGLSSCEPNIFASMSFVLSSTSFVLSSDGSLRAFPSPAPMDTVRMPATSGLIPAKFGRKAVPNPGRRGVTPEDIGRRAYMGTSLVRSCSLLKNSQLIFFTLREHKRNQPKYGHLHADGYGVPLSV